ncbi:MAG: IMPACT family protein [Paludibacter sp.]
MSFKFKTIQTISSGLYKEKGSKFISFAIPVNTVDDIKEIVNQYANRFSDARHVCYAYMLGAERTTYRTYDNGEPSGTAGKPILGQLNSHQLTDTLIIVVRYFGGILLGTSGLTNAYKEAALDAIRNAQQIEVELKMTVAIHFEYILMNEVMIICKQFNAEIITQTFENNCFMKINFKKSDESSVRAKFEKVNGLTLEIT